jgi:hypothetical protein
MKSVFLVEEPGNEPIKVKISQEGESPHVYLDDIFVAYFDGVNNVLARIRLTDEKAQQLEKKGMCIDEGKKIAIR